MIKTQMGSRICLRTRSHPFLRKKSPVWSTLVTAVEALTGPHNPSRSDTPHPHAPRSQTGHNPMPLALRQATTPCPSLSYPPHHHASCSQTHHTAKLLALTPMPLALRPAKPHAPRSKTRPALSCCFYHFNPPSPSPILLGHDL